MAIVAFTESIAASFACNSYACVNTTDYSVFPEELCSLETYKELLPDKTYDLITLCSPLGLKASSAGQLKIRQANASWSQLFEALPFLSPEGVCLSIVESNFFNCRGNDEFRECLNSLGFFVKAVFRLPENALTQATIRPLVLLMSRKQSENIFVSEIIHQEQAREVVFMLKEGNQGASLSEGVRVRKSEFTSFDHLRATLKINSLQSQYKTYTTSTIGELSIEINTCKPGCSFTETQNAIYLNAGSLKIITSFAELPDNHRFSTQIVFKDFVRSEYIKCFLETEYGRLILESASSSSLVKTLSRSALESLLVPVPSIEEQESIIESTKVLQRLTKAIEEFEYDLAVNPKNARDIIGHATNMLDQIGKITLAERVRDLIRSGESRQVEFKQTLSWDVRKGEKSKEIEKSTLKNIVAFMNSSGGTLLIGVHDNGDILGIDEEVNRIRQGSLDKFMLHLNNLINSQIGEQFYPFISIEMATLDEKRILCISCKPSQEPSYLDENDFYIKTHPATALLQGSKMIDYIRNHFLA